MSLSWYVTLIVDLVKYVLVDIGIFRVLRPLMTLELILNMLIDINSSVGSIMVDDIDDRLRSDGRKNSLFNNLGSYRSSSGSSCRMGMSKLILGHCECIDCHDQLPQDPQGQTFFRIESE